MGPHLQPQLSRPNVDALQLRLQPKQPRSYDPIKLSQTIPAVSCKGGLGRQLRDSYVSATALATSHAKRTGVQSVTEGNLADQNACPVDPGTVVEP